MTRCFSFSRYVSVLVLPLLFAGCSARDAAPPVAQTTAITAEKEKPGVDPALLAELDQPTYDAPLPKEKPLGIVVAFPDDSSGNDKRSRNFAKGIGWYLTNAVAGSPELGQSPLFTTVAQAARERKIPSFQMPLAEALRVARVCGATHVAVGFYKGGANTANLYYAIYRVADGGKQVTSFDYSAPNEEALVRELPKLARAIHTALGVASGTGTVPLEGVTPDLLARLGECADTGAYTPEQDKFLRETGKRVPLAAGLAVFIPALRAAPKDASPYARLLLKTMPNNTQTLGTLGYAVPDALRTDAPALFALSDRHKENYILAHAAAWVARSGNDWSRDAVYSARGARNAPANPDARLSAGWSLSGQADRMRQARQYTDIAPAVMAKIAPLYALRLQETKAATRCDPLYARAYQRLASAATFAGDRDEADAAMTVARKLHTDSPYETYQWALEMYQPKWGGEPGRLLEVATEAADAHYRTNDEALTIYRQLGQLQFTSLQQKMGDRLLLEAEKTITSNPKDMYARHLHGSLSHDRGKRREALADFVANAQNYPTNPGILFDLGKHYVDRSQFDKAEAPLRKSIALRPRDAETLHYLAYALKHQSKLPEAQKYSEAAVAVTPDYADALALLGTVHGMQDHIPEAIRYFERSLRVRPFQPEACINLGACYNFVGRAADAIRVGNQYLRYYPDDVNMFRVLGEAYARNGDWVESEEMNRSVLQRSPNDANAHAYLGDALWGQKNQTEARSEWEAAVRVGSPEEPVKHAKAQLKKYPAP